MIFIGNLHPSTTEKDLLTAFRRYGPILSVNYLWHKSGPLKGQPRGYAFLQFENLQSVDNALRDTGNVRIKGNLIQIKPERSRIETNEMVKNPYSLLRKRTRGNEEFDRKEGGKAKELNTSGHDGQVLKAVKSIDNRIARLKVVHSLFPNLPFDSSQSLQQQLKTTSQSPPVIPSSPDQEKE
jgi:RNA recognition motif-containing protein